MGGEADKLQREHLSNEETNSLYLATTSILEDLNVVREEKNISSTRVKELMKMLKKEDTLYDINSFDIFGNIKNDKTKISVLANQKHRESKKSIYKILDLAVNTTPEELESKLKEELSTIENCMKKINAISDCNVYYCSNEKLNFNDLQVFYFNPADAINDDTSKEKTNLYKLKIKEGMPLIYNTNIIFYDNNNQTLPVGMNVSHSATVDMSLFQIDVKKQTIFRINDDQNNFNFNEKIICAYEYEIKEKEHENTVG